MNTYKIVLTGGPCGGKSESIHFLSRKLIEQKYSVKIINETANALLKIGYVPNTNISIFDFQNLLFKIQFLNEYILEGTSEILLCDRGLFDGKVYINDTDFQKILDLNKMNEHDVFSTYACALYFKSISYEYPDEFIKKRIYETPEVGMYRDERCKTIWAEKIIFCDYNNLDGFNNKQKMIFNSLKKQLEVLKMDIPTKLSDYYDMNHFRYVYDGLNDILEKNNISNSVKEKTKELIK